MARNSIEQSIQDMRMKSRHARFMRAVVISKRGGQYIVRVANIKEPYVFPNRLLALNFAQEFSVANERYWG